MAKTNSSSTEKWIVKRTGAYAEIRCPICYEWFLVPNRPGEVEVYHFCPYCGKPLTMREEDRLRAF